MNGAELVIAGNIGKDPELRYTAGGDAVVSFSLASEERFMQNGEWKSKTTWFDVTAWKGLAENVAETLRKGDRAVVQGRLSEDSWEDKDGNKRTKLKLTADEVGVSLRWATADVKKQERSSR